MTGIIGIGNLLLKDEGLGVHFITRLREKYSFGPEIRLMDGSTSGYSLLDDIFGLDNVIVVDAVKTGEKPGSIFKFREDDLPVELMNKTAHGVEFIDVITMCALEGHRPKITIFAVAPEDCHGLGITLSPAVQNIMPALEKLVLEELKALSPGEISPPN